MNEIVLAIIPIHLMTVRGAGNDCLACEEALCYRTWSLTPGKEVCRYEHRNMN